MELVQYNQPTTGSWLVNLENGILLGTCLSLLLVGLAVSSGHGRVSLGKWKSIMMSPCITSIPATMAILCTCPLGSWGKRFIGIYRTGPIHLIIKILLCCSHPLVSIHIGHKKFLHIFCPHREVYPHTPLPNFLVNCFPIMFLSNPLPPSQTIGHTPWISI